MRQFVIILILLITTSSLFCQEKDRRTVLKFNPVYAKKHITNSPDNSKWLFLEKKVYRKDNNNSTFYLIEKLKGKNEEFILEDILYKITYLNSDTAIFYSSCSKNYFITFDNAKHFEKRYFNLESECISDIHYYDDKNIWLVSTKEKVFYSKDFLNSLTELTNEKLPSFGLNIYMENEEEGISYSSRMDWQIIATNNNWKNIAHIPSPKFQKKYFNSKFSSLRNYNNDKISKAFIWKQYYFVKQGNYVFYTLKNDIDWKKFNPRLLDIAFDSRKKILYGINEDNVVVVFENLKEYKILNENTIKSKALKFEVINDKVHILTNDNSIYEIDKQTFKHNLIFTNETFLEPNRTYKTKTANVGFTDKSIFKYDEKLKFWYRVKVVDFVIEDFKQVEKSFILWDKNYNHYIYDIENNTLKPYKLKHPLKKFLKDEIVSVEIYSGSVGCFHSKKSMLIYKKNNKEFICDSITLDRKSKECYVNYFKQDIIYDFVKNINGHPYKKLKLKDFDITDDDIEKFKSANSRKVKDYDYKPYQLERRNFMLKFENILANITSKDLETIFSKLHNNSTTSSWFRVIFTNSLKETLIIDNDYAFFTNAYNLPWKVSYDGIEFLSRNVDFSNFVNDYTPDNFYMKKEFDKQKLLNTIAYYFLHRSDWNSLKKKLDY